MTLDELVAIEEIRQLKARYFRFLDTKDWEGWANVFPEDAVLETPLTTAEPVHGRAAIVETFRSRLGDNVITVHHGHSSEITIIDQRTARGIWAMDDRQTISNPANDGPNSKRGFGHYVESYRLDEDGEWRIAALRLVRLDVMTTYSRRDADKTRFTP